MARRVHPVQVTYHIQASSQSFSTLFSTPQQVYVHPNAGSQEVDGQDEAWGAIYLKTVVQGILMAR
jgi:predicted metalloprotease with PDZ domain